MADGFFLGGAAEGMESAAKQGLARDTLAADTGLRTRGLDIQERNSANDVGLRTRALDIQERQIREARARETLTKVDKQVADTMSIIGETVKTALAAGRDPAVVHRTITPLADSAKRLFAASGRDPSLIDSQVDGLLLGGGADKPLSDIAKLRSDLSAGRINQDDFDVGLRNLANKPASVIETIRGKVANGETLSGGEQKVYDDAISADPLARALAAAAGAGFRPAATPTAAAPAPAAPITTAPAQPGSVPEFAAAADVEQAFKAGRVKKGDTVRVGGKLMRINP